jgi:molecular chaperone DnaK
VGTQVAFEFLLSDGTKVLRGTGTVAQHSDAGSMGMTIRFVALDAASRAFVQRLPPRWTPNGGGTPILGMPIVRPLTDELPDAPGEPVLGIHLGSCCAAVAVAEGRADRKPVAVPLERGLTMPAFVHLDDKGRLVVGGRAAAKALEDPFHTVFGVKRLLGRRASSAELRALAERLPYRVVADQDGEAAVLLRGNVVPATQLAAWILSALKDRAQEFLGRAVGRAVIAVPAHFGDLQRQALRRAALLAGLSVRRITSEPAAAALAFGHGEVQKAGPRLLVYSLGGGAFEASVLEVEDGRYEVVASGSDPVGGGLFDDRIAAHLLRKIEEEQHGAVSLDPSSRQRIHDAAEGAKQTLSEKPEAKVHLPALSIGEGRNADLDVVLKRAECDALTADLVEHTLEVVDAVLGPRDLDRKDVKEILLTGGQTRWRPVRDRVEEAFGRRARFDVEPDLAVALGAAEMGRLPAEDLIDAS